MKISAAVRNSPHPHLSPAVATGRNAQQFLPLRESFTWHRRCDSNARRSLPQQEVTLPTPLFDALFLIALLVPIAMYLIGLIILMVSLVSKHCATAHTRSHSVEALAQ